MDMTKKNHLTFPRCAFFLPRPEFNTFVLKREKAPFSDYSLLVRHYLLSRGVNLR